LNFQVKCMLKLIIILYLCMSTAATAAKPPIRYVALGDSYTVGTGAAPDESWPSVITSRLRTQGIPLELEGNLGRNGWSSQDLIDYELPQLRKLQPDFVTLLIGVNDWVQGVNAREFQRHMQYILAELLKIVPDPKHILVITIPDFSVTPAGSGFAFGRDVSQGIKEFNQAIITEAQRYGLRIFDLYPLSQAMGLDPSLIAPDGLHPSAKGYAQWADAIEPEVVPAVQ
jgi:lysophospholipase L1-like esterase